MSEKISFKELVRQLSERTDKSQNFTQDFIRELGGIIETGLKSSGSVTLAGFGKFELRWMKERKGIHPQTREEITIPGQYKVVFKPYRPLREHVNRTYSGMKIRLLDDSPAPGPGKSPSATAPPPAYDGGGSKSTGESGEKEKEEPLERKGFTGETPAKEETGVAGEAKIEDRTETDEETYVQPYPFFIESWDEAVDEENDETLEDLLMEKPSPVAGRMPAAPRDPGPPTLNEEIQKEGTFRWSYAAAVILVMITLLIIYYSLDGEGEPERIATTPPAGEVQPQPEPEVELPVIQNSEGEQTGFISITTQSGQTLWDLAGQHLGDPFLWPWIYHVNRDALDNPNLIFAGSELTMHIPEDMENLSGRELREVASGYVHLYKWYKNRDAENARYFLWAAGTYSSDLLDEINQGFESIDPADLRFARSR